MKKQTDAGDAENEISTNSTRDIGEMRLIIWNLDENSSNLLM